MGAIMHAPQPSPAYAGRRLPLAALTLLAGALPGCSDPAPSGPRGEVRNVLLLVCDTLRSDRLGCYGYGRDTSPHVDSLAQRGVLYASNYSQGCWTVPSMISMMSGLSVTDEETILPSKITVLAEAVRSHGIDTAAFVANQVLWIDRGFERGFDSFHTARVDGPELAASFVEWHTEREDPERPFFAWVHFRDPHYPYHPAEEHDLFEGDRLDLEQVLPRWKAARDESDGLQLEEAPFPFQRAVRRMTEASNHYDGEVRGMDDGVGRILARLEAAGELEDTLVVFCADHGEMLYEQRQQPGMVKMTLDKKGGLPEGVANLFARGHRPWYFEPLWNTPLIFAGPGFRGGERREALSANLDIYPTILAAFGLEPLPWLQGKSLMGGLESGHERVFAYGHRTTAVLEAPGTKLVEAPRELYLLEGEGEPPYQLYDLERAPLEDRDFAGDEPDVVARLAAEMEAWRARNARDIESSTSDEAYEMLRQLGYVGDEEEE